MDMAIRDLTADELERVVGGDAPVGTTSSTEGMCLTNVITTSTGTPLFWILHSCW
jgi:hypothetical protein